MKKLTAGIFTVLMGLVSVNAADAAVASQGYVDFKVGENTTAISGLSGTVQANKEAADAVAGRVTTAEGKITTLETDVGTLKTQVADETTGLIKKVTELKTQIDNVSDGNLTIKDGAINTDQLANNSVTETKLATDLATKINAKADQSALDAVSAVANAAQTADEVSAAIDGKINDLNLAETYEALNNKTQSVNEGSTENQYPSAKAVYTAVSTLENGAVKNNADAIKAIKESEYANSGITAEKVSAYDAYDAAITANATAAANAAAAASTAESNAKTYALGKANAALTASVKYTDDYITSLGLQQIASVPVDCSNDTNYCTLTANANGFAWEVIARVEGETVQRTPVTPAATTKPAAPAALTE